MSTVRLLHGSSCDSVRMLRIVAGSDVLVPPVYWKGSKRGEEGEKSKAKTDKGDKPKKNKKEKKPLNYSDNYFGRYLFNFKCKMD